VDEATSSAGALTSLAGSEDHVTVERTDVTDDASCNSPSSVTIVDLDATIDDDRRLEDVDEGRPAPPTTLKVPTPSSWEKYRVVPVTASVSPSEPAVSAADDDVKVVMVAERDRRKDHLVKDEVVDRRTTKKPCSCGALSTDVQVRSLVVCTFSICMCCNCLSSDWLTCGECKGL